MQASQQKAYCLATAQLSCILSVKGCQREVYLCFCFGEGHISRLLFYVGECSMFQKIGDVPINVVPSKEKEKVWVALPPPHLINTKVNKVKMLVAYHHGGSRPYHYQ
jgi:hypothetical protein